jgi:hypothetical protein
MLSNLRRTSDAKLLDLMADSAVFFFILAGLPDFSLFNIPKWWKIYQIATKFPKGHKMYQISVLYSK